jgi:Ca-activated chloride channel family protein
LTDLLKFSSTINRQAVPVIDQSQVIFVLLEVIPGKAMAGVRLPLNFCLVLDRSGSMTGEKLSTLKEAVKNVIERLSSEDILSIVTFESRTEILVSSQPVTDKKALKLMVDKIRDGGGTNFTPALEAALNLVSKNSGTRRLSRIVLLTDGEATDPVQGAFREADKAGALDIPIIALGFGKDWNEDFLFEIADRSIAANPGSHTGMADYIPSPKDVEKIFDDVYQSMQVVAQDVMLTVCLVHGIEVRRVWQVVPAIRELGPTAVEGRVVQLPLQHLERAGAAFLVEIMVPPRPAGAVRFAQADLTFKTPDQEIVRQSGDLILQYTHDPAQVEIPNERVMGVVEKVQAFKLQTQALADAQAGNVDSATRKLRQAVTILLSQGEQELADQMAREVDRLENSGEVSGEGKKTIMLTSRKTIHLSE